MNDLFRFMVLRAPEQVNPGTTIPIGSGQSPLTAGLEQAAKSASPQSAMTQVAQTFIVQNADFVAAVRSLHFGGQLSRITEALGHPAKPKGPNPVADLVQQVFPKPAQTVADSQFQDDKRRIHESIIALQLAPYADTSLAGVLVNLSRAVDLVERTAAKDPSLKDAGAAAEAAGRILVLPSSLFPVPSPPPQAASTDASATPAQRPSEQLAALKETLAALNEMIALNSAPTEQEPVSANLPPPARTPAQTTATGAKVPQTVIRTSSLVVAGTPATDAVRPTFSPTVQSVLADLKLDLAKTSLQAAAEKVGNAIVGLATPSDPFHESPPPLFFPDPPPTVLASPPTSHGSVRPAGIADLLVVRENVLHYEPGEIAFIENVAAAETLERRTQRKNLTENSTLTTSFSSSETERDLQVSDRFNLQLESQAAVNDNSGPGLSVSSAYGPLVDAGGAAQPAPQASSYGQDVTRRAVAKLITSTQTQVLRLTTFEFDETVKHSFDNKAGANAEIVVYQWLDKIVQAKVFSYGKRVLYDFVIPEPAVFVASARTQWQPELATLLKPTLFPLQPEDLSIDPYSYNYYQYWAAGYGATGVQPPPERRITIARTYGDKGSDPQGYNGIKATENIDIPAGYYAASATVAVDWVDDTPDTLIEVVIGKEFVSFPQKPPKPPNGPYGPFPLGNEVGQAALPLSVMVSSVGLFVINIEIICAPTAQGYAQWQARTYDTILQASRDRISEYEDQVRSLTADIQVKFAGKSADQKQALIKAELEKGCITILSNQHFETWALNAIEYGPIVNPFPQLFLPNVEPVGRYIRFFEQAFEWDQMLYCYYPYFWGRKKYWNDRLQLDDQDAEFAAFLEAGAARVTVPVRKGYENAVAAFMSNGTIPSTAALLSITTGLYVPFFVETMGAESGPDTAVSYGDPPLEWEIRVPTTLVKVRTNNTLPRWKQSIDAGRVTYVPDPPGDPVTP